jgi:hypothetical protein
VVENEVVGTSAAENEVMGTAVIENKMVGISVVENEVVGTSTYLVKRAWWRIVLLWYKTRWVALRCT